MVKVLLLFLISFIISGDDFKKNCKSEAASIFQNLQLFKDPTVIKRE